MPFVNGTEYQQLLDDRDRASELAREVARLQQQLDVRQPVGRIAIGVEQELTSAVEQELVVSEAESMAQVAVYNAERGKMVGELSEDLRRTRYDEFAEQLRIEEGPTMRAAMDQQFRTDGTYAAVERQARKKVEDDVRKDLLDQKRSEIDAELTTDEARAEIEAEVSAELARSTEVEDYRQQTRRSLREAWQEDVKATVMKDVEQEEAAGEAAFKEKYERDVRGSDAMVRKRSQIRGRLEQEWREATVEKVAVALEDEELQELLNKRAVQEKEKLAGETYARELLTDFEGLGINVADIKEKTRLVVLLGTVGNFKVRETYQDYRGYNETRDVDVKGVQCQRKLTFISLGGGRFMVDGDSLHESSSVYEQNDALPHGTIVVLGRKIQENGDQKLEQRLAADVPFYYDDDTTTPNIVDAQLCIADVRINGVSARSLEHVAMKKS